MLFVHGEQEERKHDDNHQQGGKGCSHCPLGKEKYRQAADSADAETNDLTLGQAKEKLGFDFRQILGNRHVCHGTSPPFIQDQWALKTDLAKLLVLNSVKQSSTV